MIYLDAAASAPMAPEALEATMRAYQNAGNPGAFHSAGAAAATVVERARAQVANLMDVGPASVVFTSSATEANNIALRGLQWDGERRGIVTTTIEHPSVLATAQALAANDRRVVLVPVRSSGEVDLEKLTEAISARTLVVSVQAANNETGVVQPIERVVAAARAHGALVHVDASQSMAWGRTSLLDDCDMVTISSHKMYGPQGAAALIVTAAARARLRGIVTGGGQEGGTRSGTVNVAAVAGFGAAASLAAETGPAAARAVEALRIELLAGLEHGIVDVIEYGRTAERRLPGILNVALGTNEATSMESEPLLARVPAVAASTGSACHAGSPGPSPVLLSMGVSAWAAARSIRLSLSRYTTRDDITRAVAALSDGYADLGRLIGYVPIEGGCAR